MKKTRQRYNIKCNALFYYQVFAALFTFLKCCIIPNMMQQYFLVHNFNTFHDSIVLKTCFGEIIMFLGFLYEQVLQYLL